MKLKRLEEQLEKVKYDFNLDREEREMRVLDIEIEIETVKSQFNLLRFFSDFAAKKAGRIHVQSSKYAIGAAICLLISFIVPFFIFLALVFAIGMFAILFYEEFVNMNRYREYARRTKERKNNLIVENNERKRKEAERAVEEDKKRKIEEQKHQAKAARLASMTPEECLLDELKDVTDEAINILTQYKSVARRDLVSTADKYISDLSIAFNQVESKFRAATSKAEMNQICDIIRKMTCETNEFIPQARDALHHGRNRKTAEDFMENFERKYGQARRQLLGDDMYDY